MLVFVFRAFGGAGIAHFRAERAKIGAIAIELDAARHFLHILFVQAFRRAVFAGCRASVTGIDTAVVFLVWHVPTSVFVYFLSSPQVSIVLPMYGLETCLLSVCNQSAFFIGQLKTY